MSHKKSFKRGPKGFARNLGRLPNSNSQPKFYLGHDEAEARVRNARLELLWQQVQTHWNARILTQVGADKKDDGRWDEFTLEMAKAIAKGETSCALTPPNFLEASNEAAWFCGMQNNYSAIAIVPTNAKREHAKDSLKLDDVRHAASIKGATLHSALDAYMGHCRDIFKQIGKETLTNHGYKEIETAERFKEHHDNIALSDLNFDAVEAMIVHWRNRPKHKTSGQPLSPATVSNHIKALHRFFRWLNRSQQFKWRMPDHIRDIRTKVALLPAEKSKLVSPKQVETYSVQELALIWKYATPIQRLAMLLALNCGFGAAEISSLQLDEVFLLQSPKNICAAKKKANNSSRILVYP